MNTVGLADRFGRGLDALGRRVDRGRRAALAASGGVGAVIAAGLALLPAAGVATAAVGGPAHAPIMIQSDSDFTSPSYPTGCRCVLSGKGTHTDPFVIGPWSINSGSGAAMLINGKSLTTSFVLYDLTVAGDASRSSAGVVLENIPAAITARLTGTQTAIQHVGVGVTVLGSSGVTLDGGGANPNGPGISSTGAGTINHNSIGAIDIESSSNVTVRGWQLSANGPPGAPDWVGLDPSTGYWGVGGVRLFATNGSVIDHNAANNDTVVSYSLFHSGNDVVSNNTGDYPFTSNVMVTDGSVNDTISGNDFGTADFIGILIADPLPGTPALVAYGATHDILVSGNSDHSDGGTGTERHSAISPSFVGGIVVLNGTYDNTISGNQAHSNVGGDLVWAQEILDRNSPIGVQPEPPPVSCNVTASERPIAAALNGNVWTGNSVQAQGPCIPAQ